MKHTRWVVLATLMALLGLPGVAAANTPKHTTQIKVDVKNIGCTGALVTTGQTQGPDPRLVARIKVDGVPLGDRLYSDPFDPATPQNWQISYTVPSGEHSVQVNAYVEDNDLGVWGGAGPVVHVNCSEPPVVVPPTVVEVPVPGPTVYVPVPGPTVTVTVPGPERVVVHHEVCVVPALHVRGPKVAPKDRNHVNVFRTNIKTSLTIDGALHRGPAKVFRIMSKRLGLPGHKLGNHRLVFTAKRCGRLVKAVFVVNNLDPDPGESPA